MSSETKQNLETVKPGPEALRQCELLATGAVDVLPEGELARKIQLSLDTGQPLRIKYGADPSAPDLHVGHMVPIRKLRQFQELGHHIVFIIGDFTAMIGDPSGKSETRKRLSREEVEANAATYFDQVFMTLDREKTEVVYNSHWLGKLTSSEMVELCARSTVARMLERDDFKKRFKGNVPIYIHEFLYPLVQAWDSYEVRADVEIGGTDQTFNFLLGREVQKEMGQTPQSILTMPLLVGTDGVKKMSKSLGNYIGITEAPDEIFGKAMSIPDELMADYLVLVLGHAPEDVEKLQAELAGGKLHPRELKARIAGDLVATFKGEEAADEARQHFDRVFRDRQAPEEMEEVTVNLPEGEDDIWVAPLLVEAGLAASNSKARKAVREGAVRIDGERVETEDARIAPGEFTLQSGKRNFRRVRLGA